MREGVQRIKCRHCDKSVNLSQEKIPSSGRFRLKCPYCGQWSNVDIFEESSTQERTLAPEDLAQDPGLTSTNVHLASGSVGYEDVLAAEGGENALICIGDEELRGTVRQWLKEWGYRLRMTENGREGARVFYEGPFSLLVLEDNEESAPLLREIHSLPGIMRREINCVILGDRASSFDIGQAFRMGVNTYLSRGDLEKLPELLSQAISSYRRFIQPWLAARGAT